MFFLVGGASMIGILRAVFTHVAVLGFGLAAGFFFAFSVVVIPGLERAGGDAAVPAMQGINAAVRNPFFFAMFFLSPVIALFAALFALGSGRRRSAFLLVLAAVAYLALVYLPTTYVHVPLNERLAAVTAAEDQGEAWFSFVRRWTDWNHFRAVASLYCLLLCAAALTPFGQRTRRA